MYVCMHACMYVKPLGASKSQPGGTYISSLFLFTVNVYCDYIYIYLGSSHRVMLCWCLRSTAKFETTVLIKCVTHAGSSR